MSTYEISKSSLLSLKAEILKKHEELHKVRIENKIKLQKDKKPLELKNKGVESRAADDGGDIDEDVLKKSRSALEAKSKLYEKLSQGSKTEEEQEYNRRFLVQFDQKPSSSRENNDHNKTNRSDEEDDNDLNETYSDDESEWVEFIDSFGRTRTCLKQDLAAFKAKDEQIRPRQREESRSPSPAPEETSEFDEKSELLSGDMRRELQRQQWEREEEQLKDKSDVHYQDILYSEARTHGVGYYGFSKDEATRTKQQKDLTNLRKETEAQQKQAQEIRHNRERQLAARVRAAKNRKRAREGLPPITSDDEEEERRLAEEKNKELEEKRAENEKISTVITEIDREKERNRSNHIRPWDIGKEGVESARIRSGARDPYDQDEWNEIQREKRNAEFAPPRSYADEQKSAVSRNTTNENVDKHRVNPYKRGFRATPIQNECSSSEGEEQDELMKDYARSRSGINIPPPTTYDYYGPSGTTKRQKQSGPDMEDAIMQGLKFLREKVEKSNA